MKSFNQFNAIDYSIGWAVLAITVCYVMLCYVKSAPLVWNILSHKLHCVYSCFLFFLQFYYLADTYPEQLTVD